MKKLLALLLCLIFVFSIAACGEKPAGNGEETKDPVSNVESSEEEEKDPPPVLDGTDEYVVVARLDSDITINSLDDLKNYSVGIINNTDSAKVGEYYAKDCFSANMDNDIMSRFAVGGEGDLAIIRKMAAEQYTERVKIVYGPIVIE